MRDAGAGGGAKGEAVGKGGDSDSDSNFEEESRESDGGSPSSSGSSSGPDEHEGGKESDNEGGSGEGTEGNVEPEGDDDEEIVELDQQRHPLLRAAAAGAMPKMSRAVVVSVGLVFDDFVGQRSSVTYRRRHFLYSTRGTTTTRKVRKTSWRAEYSLPISTEPSAK